MPIPHAAAVFVDLGASVTREVPLVAFPFVVIQGSADATVDPAGAQALFDESAAPLASKRIVIVAGGTHQLLSEPNPLLYEAALGAIVDFLQGLLPAVVAPGPTEVPVDGSAPPGPLGDEVVESQAADDVPPDNIAVSTAAEVVAVAIASPASDITDGTS